VTTAPLPGSLARRVHQLEQGFSGVLALWVHDLRRRETFGLRADDLYPAASVIKLFILRELFRQVEEGLASPGEEVVMRQRDVVPGSGVLRDLSPGLRLRLEDAATLMTTVSDNVAANLLIGRLGTYSINRATRGAGFAGTRLSGKLFRPHKRRSTTTAHDAGRLMLELARREAVSRAASSQMLEILRREQSNDIVGRFLPEAPSEGGLCRPWRIASKNGALPGVRHDVAYVEGPSAAYVLALMSRDCGDLEVSRDNEATVCLARVARAVHDHVNRQSSHEERS
jgi:beta-lactamase class A